MSRIPLPALGVGLVVRRMDGKSETAPATAMNTVASGQATKRRQLSFPVFLLLVILAALAFRSFAFSLFNIPSESMLPRLMNGDYLVASKWSYGISKHSLPFELPVPEGRLFARQPDRGDIVIFKHPVDLTEYVKRVVGLPGDTVEMRGGQVILNGRPVAQQATGFTLIPTSANTPCRPGVDVEQRADGSRWCRYPTLRETVAPGVSYDVIDLGQTPQDYRTTLVVPEGRMFLMGDNRDNSLDSRFPAEPAAGVGLVPQDLLVGKAQMLVWSTDGSAEWLKPWTWFTAARGGRMGDAL